MKSEVNVSMVLVTQTSIKVPLKIDVHILALFTSKNLQPKKNEKTQSKDFLLVLSSFQLKPGKSPLGYTSDHSS